MRHVRLDPAALFSGLGLDERFVARHVVESLGDRKRVEIELGDGASGVPASSQLVLSAGRSGPLIAFEGGEHIAVPADCKVSCAIGCVDALEFV